MTNGYPHLSTLSVLTKRFPYNIVPMSHYETESSPCWHDFTKILYTVSGSYYCIINNTRYFCPEGSVVIIYPYSVYKIDLSETNFDEINIIKIEMSEKPNGFSALTYENGVFCGKILPCFTSLSSDEKEKADCLFSKILAEYEKKQNMSIVRITELISSIFSLCAEKSDSLMPKRQLKNAKKRAKEIRLVTDFIKENYKQNLTVSDVTEISKLSKSGFMNKFKAVTGFTFNEYFSRVRAYEALSILRYSTKSVAEVAEEFGYSSDARFVHSCARLFKKSPLQIKKDWMRYDKVYGADIHKVDIKEQAWKNVWGEEELYIRTANAEAKY
ncbi:MAG: helix-turn-helix transcriptional regulator [Oscillospiraceae bacterium]|nr:helix-turn-helix transcriptional regulator [Oscillospiraceae bacterium]